MAAVYEDIVSWELERDDDGHRTYMLRTQVRTTSYLDGPSVALSCVGLPTVGSVWIIGNDNDPYAWCTPYAKVTSKYPGERQETFYVDQRFTTRPMSRCNTNTIENPLSEPAKLSGGFGRYTEEALYDRFGDLLLMSSYELMTGPEVEVEMGRPIVRVSLNVASLPLTTISQYRGGVNDSTMWGLPARTIRLSDVSWERNIYGTCTYYYTITYEFEVRYETWNRFIIDKGQYSKLIKANPFSASNPLVPIVDKTTGRWYTAYLDGSGGLVEYVGAVPDPNEIYVFEKQIEPQFNFFTLGIPASL